MRLFCISILVFLLFFYCGSDVDVQTVEIEPLTDVLTLELSFGDEKTIDKNEFLIAQPRYIQVNDSGDIYVYDEDRIKVYDEKGQAMNIIGGPGEGPGEFGIFFRDLSLSSSGYLLVQERSSYSLFSPEHKFIEERQLRTLPYYNSLKNDYKVDMVTMGLRGIRFYVLNEKELVISADDLNAANYNEENNYNHYLFCAYEDKLVELVSYKKVNSVAARREGSFGVSSVPYLGNFYYSILPGNRIVYTHSGLESEIRNGIGYMTFHIINKDGSGKLSFEWMYTTEEIEKSYIDNYEIGITLSGYKPKEAENRIKKMLREKKFKAPFTDILSDGTTLFLLKSQMEGDSSYYIVNVIDTESGAHLSSFRTDLSISNIKDGYAYKISDYYQTNEFPEIEKYKINPAVYGK